MALGFWFEHAKTGSPNLIIFYPLGEWSRVLGRKELKFQPYLRSPCKPLASNNVPRKKHLLSTSYLVQFSGINAWTSQHACAACLGPSSHFGRLVIMIRCRPWTIQTKGNIVLLGARQLSKKTGVTRFPRGKVWEDILKRFLRTFAWEGSRISKQAEISLFLPWICLRWFFSLSIVNHHFAPPFGECFYLFFPTTEQANLS